MQQTDVHAHHLARPADDILAFLEPGGCTLVLVGPSGSGKTTLLDELLARLPGKIIKVANPLVSPITPDRFLFQIGGTSDDRDDGEAIIQCLLGTPGNGKPTTLAVDDAHSLDPQVWPVLARIPGLVAPNEAGMNLIIATRPELLDALPRLMLHATQGLPRTLIVTLPEPAHMRPPVAVEAPAAAAIAPPPATRSRRPGRPPAAGPPGRSRLAWIGGAAVLAVAVIAVTSSVTRPAFQAFMAAPVSAPASGPPQMAVIAVPATIAGGDSVPAKEEAMANDVGQASAPAIPGSSDQPELSAPMLPLPAQPLPRLVQQGSSISDNQLRQEFAAFLRRAGRDTASLAPSARDALYREYLSWRERGLSGQTEPGAN